MVVSVDNCNICGGDGMCGLQVGQLQFGVQWLDNSQGQVVIDGGVWLQINGQLQNIGGVISIGGNLDSQVDNVVNSGGLLCVDGSQMLVVCVFSEDGQVYVQWDFGFILQQGMCYCGEWIVNGMLLLNLFGDFDNQGVVCGGNFDFNVQNIINVVLGEIFSQGMIYFNVCGQLINRGLIDGVLIYLEVSEIDNFGIGCIYGDCVVIFIGVLKNCVEEVVGVICVGIVVVCECLDLGVCELQNIGKGLIYSGGDVVIGGMLSVDCIVSGIVGWIDNISLVIDVIGNLFIDVQVVNNICENVVIIQIIIVNVLVCMD